MPTCRRGTTRATTSITLKRLRCQAGACHRSRPEKCTEHPLPSDGVARLLHGLPGPSTPCRDGIRGGTCLRSTRPLPNLRGAGWLRLSPLVDVQRVSRTECPKAPPAGRAANRAAARSPQVVLRMGYVKQTNVTRGTVSLIGTAPTRARRARRPSGRIGRLPRGVAKGGTDSHHLATDNKLATRTATFLTGGFLLLIGC